MKRLTTKRLREILKSFLLEKEELLVCPRCHSTDLGQSEYCVDDRFEPPYYRRKCRSCGANPKASELVKVELTEARVKRALGL